MEISRHVCMLLFGPVARNLWVMGVTMKPLIQSIEPQASLSVQVVNQLRHLIITRLLPSGSRLVEASLSSQFGTSRGPIRDALRVLEAEGLVQPKPGGMYVRGLSRADVDELYGLRGLIENEALRICTQDGGRDWRQAEFALQRMRRAVTANDPVAVGQADLDYHSAFYAQAGHHRLEQMWNQYRPTFGELMALSNAEPSADLEATLHDHEDLLQAVQFGDFDEVRRLFMNHNTESRRRMRAFVSGDRSERDAKLVSE